MRRCGQVHESDEVITLFVEELNPEIRCLIQTCRDNNKEVSYLELIQQTRYEEVTIRARTAAEETTRTRPQVVRRAGSVVRRGTTVAVLELPPDSDLHSG